MKKGRKEGRQEAYRGRVRRQSELKFGALDSVTIGCLEAADETALARYIERVLTATSLDRVLGE